MDIKLHNSLSKNTETFSAINSNAVGMYTCGPTVYSFVTIGNWRTYVLGDLVHRVLKYNGFHVNYYMNITDVGHLTGDNSGDADTGVDRMEKAKEREGGKNAWDIANFYSEDFIKGYSELNLLQPKAFLRATEHIDEQISLIQKLFDSGLAYVIDDGVYFDTAKYEESGFVYGELSNLDQIIAGARVDFNNQKKNIRDFALWKLSPKNSTRDMEWESPWGVGFPGWHIECSAMSMKYLGNQFDIHVGGEDLKSTHHPNEIAQAQGATGVFPFVKYWLHGAFLQVDGGRMGKSLGNAYTLGDIKGKNIDPSALRYFYMSSHYRSPLNFTWEALEASNKALSRIKEYVSENASNTEEIVEVDTFYKSKFISAINNDLNIPLSLGILHELLHDKNISHSIKVKTILNFDEVLGLGLAKSNVAEIPTEVLLIVERRENARNNKDWSTADKLRIEIEDLGYKIKDTDDGQRVSKM